MDSPLHADNKSAEKASLRLAMRSVLRAIDSERRTRCSLQAAHRLRQTPVWNRARSVLFYSPLPDELDLTSLIPVALASGKVVALPRFDTASGTYGAAEITGPFESLPSGKFGIREPALSSPPRPLNQLDFVLVPGVAFDWQGRRLGRGRGFYDRLLAKVLGIKCGVGYDEQFHTGIPLESHDVLLNCVLTPTCWRSFRSEHIGDELVG